MIGPAYGPCPLCGGVYERDHSTMMKFATDRVLLYTQCPDGGSTLIGELPVGKVSETPAIRTLNTEIHKAIQALTRKVD